MNDVTQTIFNCVSEKIVLLKNLIVWVVKNVLYAYLVDAALNKSGIFENLLAQMQKSSVDYDPHAEISIEFFKKVQNKIHYAVHGQTAAEVIYNRADAEKEFMGLITFKGNRPHLQDVVIAKNYLSEKELRRLGQIVSGYLDFAERQAGQLT